VAPDYYNNPIRIARNMANNAWDTFQASIKRGRDNGPGPPPLIRPNVPRTPVKYAAIKPIPRTPHADLNGSSVQRRPRSWMFGLILVAIIALAIATALGWI
jgi:hypothetical protein